MLLWLLRVRRRLGRVRTGVPAAIVMVAVFVTSWPLMVLAEPEGSQLVEPDTYWWWFVVTGSTVGYGDFFPETTAGRVIAVYVIIGAIAALTTLFTQLADVIERARGRRMQGAITIDMSDHVVVLGYGPGRSERIVDELLADDGRPVVLCAWSDIEGHPMTDRDVEFVRGDLVDEAVLRRAGVQRAYAVLVDARDDNEALAMAVSVHHVNPDVHTVVTLRDVSRAEHFTYVSDTIRCVQWHVPRMATEEVEDPGITEVYQQLMTAGGGNTYSMRLTEATTFGELQTIFGREHDATILAARTGDGLLVCPGWTTPVPAGAVIYYIARHRLEAEQALASSAAT